jgi:hypothetical protein
VKTLNAPGHRRLIVATSAHRKVRPLMIALPCRPPGARYGRSTAGNFFRSRYSAGKIAR